MFFSDPLLCLSLTSCTLTFAALSVALSATFSITVVIFTLFSPTAQPSLDQIHPFQVNDLTSSIATGEVTKLFLYFILNGKMQQEITLYFLKERNIRMPACLPDLSITTGADFGPGSPHIFSGMQSL